MQQWETVSYTLPHALVKRGFALAFEVLFEFG